MKQMDQNSTLQAYREIVPQFIYSIGTQLCSDLQGEHVQFHPEQCDTFVDKDSQTVVVTSTSESNEFMTFGILYKTCERAHSRLSSDQLQSLRTSDSWPFAYSSIFSDARRTQIQLQAYEHGCLFRYGGQTYYSIQQFVESAMSRLKAMVLFVPVDVPYSPMVPPVDGGTAQLVVFPFFYSETVAGVIIINEFNFNEKVELKYARNDRQQCKTLSQFSYVLDQNYSQQIKAVKVKGCQNVVLKHMCVGREYDNVQDLLSQPPSKKFDIVILGKYKSPQKLQQDLFDLRTVASYAICERNDWKLEQRRYDLSKITVYDLKLVMHHVCSGYAADLTAERGSVDNAIQNLIARTVQTRVEIPEVIIELQKKHDLEIDQLKQDFRYQLEQQRRQLQCKIDESQALLQKKNQQQTQTSFMMEKDQLLTLVHHLEDDVTLLKHQLDQLLTIQSYGRDQANTFNILESAEGKNYDQHSIHDSTSDILFDDADICVTLTKQEPDIKIDVPDSSSMMNAKDQNSLMETNSTQSKISANNSQENITEKNKPLRIIALPEDEINFNGPRKYHPRYAPFFEQLRQGVSRKQVAQELFQQYGLDAQFLDHPDEAIVKEWTPDKWPRKYHPKFAKYFEELRQTKSRTAVQAKLKRETGITGDFLDYPDRPVPQRFLPK